MFVGFAETGLWPCQLMRYLDEFIEDAKQLVLDGRHRVLEVHFAFPLHHLYYQKCILKLIVNWIGALILNDGLKRTERLSCERGKEVLVLFNGSIDKFSDDVAEQGSIGLTKLLYVKLIAVEGLDLLVVLLRNYLTELMKEDVLGLSDVLGLHSDELRNCHSFVSLLGQA